MTSPIGRSILPFYLGKVHDYFSVAQTKERKTLFHWPVMMNRRTWPPGGLYTQDGNELTNQFADYEFVW